MESNHIKCRNCGITFKWYAVNRMIRTGMHDTLELAEPKPVICPECHHNAGDKHIMGRIITEVVAERTRG